MFMLVKSYNKLRAAEDVPPPPPPSEKIYSECAMSIPVAAKKYPYCGTIHI